MSETCDDVLDDLFHGSAFAAFIDEMAKAKAMPCPTRVKYRAYDYYEEALAERQEWSRHDTSLTPGFTGRPPRT